MTCDQGDFAEYAGLRRSLTEREGDLSRFRASSRRAEAARSLSLLRPGDIIRVPGGRRAGLAVVLQPGLRPARGSNGNGHAGGQQGSGAAAADYTGPGPLVLTEGRQVKRLAVADFPVPAEVIDKIRIPGSFSPRSPQHRKDLAATMRNRLASQEPGQRARRPVRAADWEQTAPEAAGEITDLRRRLRRHPCHACPDRESHARYAERYFRLARETEALDRRVAGRSHVIARTFDRVCRVLESLGYLAGDTVTGGRAAAGPPVHRAGPAGRRVPAPRPVGRPVRGRARRLRLGPVVRVAPGRRRPAAPAAQRRGPRGAGRHPPHLGRTGPAGEATTSCRSCASPTSASPGPPTAGRAAPGWRRSWPSRPTSPPATSSARSSSSSTCWTRSPRPPPPRTPGPRTPGPRTPGPMPPRIPRPLPRRAGTTPGHPAPPPRAGPTWPRRPAPPSTPCAVAWSPTPPSPTDQHYL